jgi:hypothetical protein
MQLPCFKQPNLGEFRDGFDRRLDGKDVEPDAGEMPARTDQT